MNKLSELLQAVAVPKATYMTKATYMIHVEVITAFFMCCTTKTNTLHMEEKLKLKYTIPS